MFSVSKMKKTIVKNSSLKKTFFILIVFVATILLHTINKQILWTKVNQNTRHFVKSIKGARAVKITSANKECKSVVWNNAPSLSIMCRGYHGSVMEFYNIFLVGYNLFWPKDQWPNSDLVVVLDDDSELDHRLGTVLASLPPYPNVYFETIPQQETFCSGDRRAGYSRQQYSNFYSDLYTDKDYVGIVDTDTYFQGPVVPENLFVDGKPRIVGQNACCTTWEESLNETIGGGYNVAEFMVANSFPILIKREHFKPMREHITKQMKANTFEEAFHKVCTKYLGKYSQFDMMIHYLWFHHRDEYSWHLIDWEQTRHPRFTKRMTNRKEVLSMNRPIEYLMKHYHHFHFPDFAFKLIGDYYCLGTDNNAGTCKRFFSRDVRKSTFLNWFYEWQYNTIDWEERQMDDYFDPFKYPENIWALPNFTYLDLYNSYNQKLKKRDYLNANCSIFK